VPVSPSGGRVARASASGRWIVDNACGHRFGGIGVEGLHCDVEMHEGGGHDGHDHGEDGGDDHGSDHDHEVMPSAMPADPVTAEPTFTG
jgi:hypothetical protein